MKNLDYAGRVKGASVFVAVFLSVLAELSVTFATFMPMKSLLIVALDEVPSFFPIFLISAGAPLASFILLVASIVLALFGFWVKSTLGKAGELRIAGGFLVAPGRYRKNKSPAVPWKLKELSNLVLMGCLLLGISVISLPLFISIIAWLILTLWVIFFATVKGEIRPPYLTFRSFFQGRARKWLTVSSLWSTVALAFFAVLVYPPTFGLTAVLLVAVLMLRLQRSVAELGHRVLLLGGGRKLTLDDQLNRHLVSETSFTPLEFFGSENGFARLAQEITKLGFPDSTFTRVGIPNRSQMSLLVSQSGQSNPFLLRIFAPDKLDNLEREEKLLADLSGHLLPPALGTRVEIAGFPSLLVRWASVLAVCERLPSLESLASWQLAWDRACVDKLADRNLVDESEIPDPQEFLFPLLVALGRFNGSHNEVTAELIRTFSKLRQAFLSGSRVYSFQDRIRAENFLEFEGGIIRPIDLSELKINVLGAVWAPLHVFEKKWKSFPIEEKPFDAAEFLLARIRSQAMDASRHARSGNYQEFVTVGREILRSLSGERYTLR